MNLLKKPLPILFSIFLSGIILTGPPGWSQVGIGTTNPVEGTILDITSTTSGILIPRVALNEATDPEPIFTTAPLTPGILVFNTATTGTTPSDLSPGFHYWSGDSWLRILDSNTTAPIANLYNSDGTLTQNRTVSQEDHTLSFLGETGRNLIILQRSNNAIATGLSFRNSGNSYDASIFMESQSNQGLVIASGGNDPNPDSLIPTVIFNNNTTSSFSNELSIYDGIANQGPVTGKLQTQAGNGVLALYNGGILNHSLDAGGESVFNVQQQNLDVRFATDNQPSTLFIDGQQDNVAIGTNTAIDGVALTITNDNFNSAIVATLGATTTGNVVEASTAGSGNGIVGVSANRHGVFGLSGGSSSFDVLAGVLGINTASTNGSGVVAATTQIANSGINVGLRAISGGAVSIAPEDFNNVGIAVNARDLAFSAITENPIVSRDNADAALFQTNYSGTADNPDARDPQARLAGFEENVTIPSVGNGDTFYGAYLYSGGDTNGSFAYAGARHDGTNYKIIGNGAVSTVVADAEGNADKRIMFAPEAPEVFFEDYGGGKLQNGKAVIQIDPIFSENIIVNQDHPLRVFIQLEGDCNGVYVTGKSSRGFVVTELQNGQSNIHFSWHIVANRKDEAGRSSGKGSKYSELRFPEAPVPQNKTFSSTRIDDARE